MRSFRPRGELLRSTRRNMQSCKMISRLTDTVKREPLAPLGRNKLLKMQPAAANIVGHSFSSDANEGRGSHTRNTENKCHECGSGNDQLHSLASLLKEILEYRTKKVSSWIIEKRVKALCQMYMSLTDEQKKEFITVLAATHSINHKQVYEAAKVLFDEKEANSYKFMKIEDQLRNFLTPHYMWLFMHIGRLERGVKFLVDLRTDLLELIAEKNISNNPMLELHKLNTAMKELLSMWFSVGFLELERITWMSPCDLLQKISEYEAVLPITSWTDLKRRVGPYRRCFVFLHRSMPGEPLVVLHTALREEISSSVNDIVSVSPSVSETELQSKANYQDSVEDPSKIKAAVFYSVTSTQKGLKGIELGNYLIKRVAREVQNEFPQLGMFSSLSPIPTFRTWILERLNHAKKGRNDLLSKEEMSALSKHFDSGNVLDELKRRIVSNEWVEDPALTTLLRDPLMRLCARYLYLEKRRGYALDNVANFHLKNGAVMWRLNWKANLSPKGLSNSCGIMVNYRYYLEEAEWKSIAYLEKQSITASDQVTELASQAQKLMITSKM